MSKSRCVTDGATKRALAAFATGRKTAPKPRKAKRGLLSASRDTERRTIVEHRAVDEFGEMGDRKREAAAQARAKGHQMGAWHKRGDAYGRQDCYCVDCNRLVTCCVEQPTPYNLPFVYGNALTEPCTKGT